MPSSSKLWPGLFMKQRFKSLQSARNLGSIFRLKYIFYMPIESIYAQSTFSFPSPLSDRQHSGIFFVQAIIFVWQNSITLLRNNLKHWVSYLFPSTRPLMGRGFFIILFDLIHFFVIWSYGTCWFPKSFNRTFLKASLSSTEECGAFFFL